MTRYLSTIFLLILSINVSAIDLNENGITDKFDTVINPLPTPSMRVAARQLVFSMQELMASADNLPLNDEQILILSLNHLIANECFEHARISSESTINNNLFWFSIVQLAASETDRLHLNQVLQSFSKELVANASEEYNDAYLRLSPFSGQFSGCDHLN